jgi:toxin YhaV
MAHGWMIMAHPLLLDQLEKLTSAVEDIARKRPDDYQKSADAKLLAALHELIFNRVPLDPTAGQYRQGGTLGAGRKHWFRAKFGNGRFRLFFRYDSRSKIIIFAWVNDENSLRTYGARTDAYAVFRKMLEQGNPPDDWAALLAAASAKSATERLDASQDGRA